MQTYITQLAQIASLGESIYDSKHKILKHLVPLHVESLQAYQPGRPPDQLKKDLGIERFINLASNENPLGPSPMAMQAIVSSITDIYRYPESGGLLLRQALANKYDIGIGNVALGSGSESIIGNIIRAFLHGEDEALTSAGTFIGLRVLIKAQGIKLVEIPLKNYHFDLTAIAEAINEKTKLIYLCNPNNPTGTIFTKAEFDSFIKKVPEHVLIILDEAYYEFSNHIPEYPDSTTYNLDNVLTLRTFSKAYGMAGIRLGYGIGHEYLISFINKIKLPFEPNNLAQTAGLVALNDIDFLEKSLTNNQQGMKFLQAAFTKMGLKQIPSTANFIMLDLENIEHVTHIHESLLRKGIAIRPLKGFGLPHCIRITIGTPDENELLIDAMQQIFSNEEKK